MKKDKMDKIEVGISNESIGIYINIINLNGIKKYILEHPAQNIIEVRVALNDITKEFTFQDFFTRLGFKEKKGKWE